MQLGYTQSLTQTQNISQRMIQSAHILQMTAIELRDYIYESMMENPAIEVEEPVMESIDKQEWLNSLDEENHYITAVMK